MRRIPVISWTLVALIAFVIGLMTASYLGTTERGHATGIIKDDSEAISSDSGDQDLNLSTFRIVAENQKPTVVNISTKKVIKAGNSQGFLPFGQGGGFFQEFFGQEFFGLPNYNDRDFTQQNLGSGVIVDADGYILTNNHVIDQADEIEIQLLNDEKKYEAKVVGSDPKTDLALLKIDAKNLTAARFGDSDTLHVGDWVMAIGNPFGWSHTVTVGVVSALHRPLQLGPYDEYIQTDASINPGNSGGPLFNHRGEVVGINTAITTRSGGNQGIGFAIPINVAKKVVPQLKDKGEVIRGWLGVSIQKVTPDLAEKYELSETAGALVAQVVADSPAEKAGIEQGDVIISFDGKAIKDVSDLSAIVADTLVGAKVKVELVRNGQHKSLKIEVAQYPKDEAILQNVQQTSHLGLQVQDLTPALARQLGLDDTFEGVIVNEVEAGSPAEDAGMIRGDVIVSVEREPVKSAAEFYELMQKNKNLNSILFLIQRGAQPHFVVVKRDK
ncbi:DegQ family serine endoprotease [bacterium]|nr:DegQ family serine endoprotease [bacterium]